jgi:Lipopolysaccharide assembly protein A domain
VKRTRAGGVWIAAVSFAVILVLLLIFILQNSQKVQISYFGAHGQLPLGVALLFAAVLGIFGEVGPGRGSGLSTGPFPRNRFPNRACDLHRTRLSTSPGGSVVVVLIPWRSMEWESPVPGSSSAWCLPWPG